MNTNINFLNDDSITIDVDSMTINDDSITIDVDSMTINDDSMTIDVDSMTINDDSMTIDVEYNDHHWCYTGIFVLLIKNHDKIVYRYDNVANNLILDYDDGDGEERLKFMVFLNKK